MSEREAPDAAQAGSGRPVEDLSFEEAMAELEGVVERLDSGDVALDLSIALYERGAALKDRCSAKLAEAEEKVAAITLDEAGQPRGTAPLDAAPARKATRAAARATPAGADKDDEIPF